jgi:hypothetical protein
MNHGVLWLFAIPTVCILVIAFAQFKDEMFKKKFVIDRRQRRSDGSNPTHNRRYSDRRQPAAASEATSEEQPPATQTSGNSQILETSGTNH